MFEKVTAIATALSVIVLVMTLCWDHRWRRRQYAIGLLEKWNDCTADHAKAILTEFPWLRERGAQIDSLLSEEIYCCKPGDRYWEVRFHLVELLNHAEAMAVAIDRRIAAKSIIGSSVDSPLNAWHDNLKGFLAIVEKCDHAQPWQGFVDYMEILDANCKTIIRLKRLIMKMRNPFLKCLKSIYHRASRKAVKISTAPYRTIKPVRYC